MTAVAERRTVSEGTCYEVYCPDSGQVLGYVNGNGTGADLRQPLGQALEQNGFRLVAAEPRPLALSQSDVVP